MIRLLLLVCILAAIEAIAADERLRLPVGSKVFTLRTFGQVNPNWDYFGEYHFPLMYTGGTKLHLFPNGRFVISEWVDVGGDELLAAGSFKLHNDRLALEFSRIAAEHEHLKQRFSDLHLLYGRIETETTVSGFEVFVFTGKGWETLRTDGAKPEYLSRHREYSDWESILRGYEAQKQ